MASITIRNLEDETKQFLRVKAAEEGVSLEAYLRNWLHSLSSASKEEQEPNLLEITRNYFSGEASVEVVLPSRSSQREAPSFE